MVDNRTPLSQIGQAVLALLQVAEIGRQAGEDLFTLSLDWNSQHGRWQINAITSAVGEETAIDAVRWWADAIGGTVHLSEVRTAPNFRGGTRDYRRLDGRGEIAGVLVKICEHLYDLAPAVAAVPVAA